MIIIIIITYAARADLWSAVFFYYIGTVYIYQNHRVKPGDAAAGGERIGGREGGESHIIY